MPKEALQASPNSADKEVEEIEEPSEEPEEISEEETGESEGAEIQETEQGIQPSAGKAQKPTWKGASSELFNELKNPINWIKYFFGIILSILLLISGIIKWFFRLLLKRPKVLILFLVLVLVAMLWIIFGK
ncbi:MAG: hypothetical protein HYW05_04320 [Candidatus Diapherotrites archaeon]|nr:hypothetical protein [Candidatus Diapherotrites archaeon]